MSRPLRFIAKLLIILSPGRFSPPFKRTVIGVILSAFVAGGFISNGMYYELLDQEINPDFRSIEVHGWRSV